MVLIIHIVTKNSANSKRKFTHFVYDPLTDQYSVDENEGEAMALVNDFKRFIIPASAAGLPSDWPQPESCVWDTDL